MQDVSEVTQSHPTLCDPMDCAHQAPPSMEFSRQEYWSGLPFPSPGHLPDPGIEPRSPPVQADTLLSEPPGKLTLVQFLGQEDPLEKASHSSYFWASLLAQTVKNPPIVQETWV